MAGPGTGANTCPVSHGRNELIDALKFFAISLVVLQHLFNLRPEFKTLAPGLVEALFAFNMPLFVFLSGYVLLGRERDSALVFIKERALALLVPYVSWILVVMPLRHFQPAEWGPRLAGALLDPHLGFQMWFLLVLFWVLVVFRLGLLASAASWWIAGFGLVVTIALNAVVGFGHGMDKLAWLFPFLVAGYLVSRHREPLRRTIPLFTVGGIAGFAAAAYYGFPYDWRYATAVAGITASWGLYRLLPRRLIAWQSWAGKRSLGVYGGQMVVFPFVLVGTGWLGAAASFVTVTAASLGLTLLLERSWLTRGLFLGSGFKRPRRL